MYESVDGRRIIWGVDVFQFESVIKAIAAAKPAAVVNCIGIVKQLDEAKDPIISIYVNALFPHHLATACDRARVRLLHVSTDCVFSGRKGNYTEDDIPDPEDLYGRTKLLGEVSSPHLTLRTSIFGPDPLKGTALLEWFLRQQGGRVRGYKNAIYSGFPTRILATIMADVLAEHPNLSGLYHVASAPISKYELLCRIREVMRLDIEVEPFDDQPCDRSLNAGRFVRATGREMPSWDEMLAELASDTTPYDEWRRQYESS